MRSTLCTLAVLVTVALSTRAEAKGARAEQEEKEMLANKDMPTQSGRSSCFRAAVVDYSPMESARDCHKGSGENLNVYEKIVKIAKANGAQIVVFPEYGITIGTVGYMQPCLEEIPDPAQVTDFNPCLQPDRFPDQTFPILTRLSCLARENGLYLVANYGTKQAMDDSQSGQFLMLNTNVVFDPTGLFIRRYRKWHPFVLGEPFAKAPQLEHVYFDTEFGRMGVFTCFDMLFKQPAMDLVEQYQIDTAIFPTDWLDEVPLLTAVQIQDGWSSANQVNLLASNLLRPDMGAIGSGIYSGNRSLYRAPGVDQPGEPRKTQILISTIPAKKNSDSNSCEPKSKIIGIDDNANYESYMRLSYMVLPDDTIEGLTEIEGKKTLCSGGVCCTVDYKLAADNQAADQVRKLVILVRDSIRLGGWYEQVCTVATLKAPYVKPRSPFDLDQLQFDSDAAVGFERLSLRAELDTNYVFPSCAHNTNKLVERDQRRMHCQQGSAGKQVCELDYIPDKKKSSSDANRLYAFGLYGRVFERDQEEQLPVESLMGAVRLTSK